MSEYALIPMENLQKMIFTMRGVQVMLDKDIAALYEVKPIRLREQVQRNIERFPDDFMFQLTEVEVNFMVSQNAIPSRKNLGGFLPYVFTEQGVAGLSGVLRSARAAQMHVNIMRAFVEMRRFLSTNTTMFERIENVEKRQLSFEIKANQNFEKVFMALETEAPAKQGIFYDGQIFDAYAFAAELIRSAKKSLVLIDNYIDDSVLTMFSKRRKNVSAELYTRTISKQLKLDLLKHNQQYEEIKIHTFADAHDRFLIVDGTDVYHIGASLKDLGKK